MIDCVITEDNWEKDCLLFNPFEGDYSDGERILSDKIVSAGKVHFPGCHMCGNGIAKGEAHRCRAEANYDKVVSYRFCQLCCIAMAAAANGDRDAIHERPSIQQ